MPARGARRAAHIDLAFDAPRLDPYGLRLPELD